MPVRQVDSHSGAIVFVPTPEEASIQTLRMELEEELAKIRSFREEMEASTQTKTKSK